MIRKYVSIGLLTSLLFTPWFSSSEEVLSVPKGPYLGQKAPSLVPKVFAPDVISVEGRYEGTISFSPELNEVYFGANNPGGETHIYFSKLTDKGWTTIKRANFTKGEKDEEIHPFVSRDGKRIYFTGLNSDLSDTRIWYVNRFDQGWGNPVKLGSPINNEQVFYANQANSDELYYFNLNKGKTFYASASGGSFNQTQELALAPGFHHAVIAPSQDYMIVNGRNKEEGRKDNDLFVCFKQADGSWSNPINLGKAINTSVNEKGPSITHDGKYLFFGRDESDGKANIYWVSTEVIDRLKANS